MVVSKMKDRFAMSSGVGSSVEREDLRSVPLHCLKRDANLAFPIHTEEGVLLLSKGSVVSDRNLNALENRGIRRILVHRSESAASLPIEAKGAASSAKPTQTGLKVGVANSATRRLDMLSAKLFPQKPSGRAMRDEVPSLGLVSYDPRLRQQLWESHETFVSGFRNVLRSLASRQGDEALQTQTILHQYLEFMKRDIDLFTCFAGSPHHSHYPFRHSLHVAMLSVAMGLRAGFNRNQLHTLGLGALLHDMGMLRVPRKMWSKASDLEEEERTSMMEHPIHTVTAMESNTEINEEVKLICYQVHERANGMGYPRLRVADQIHPFAKIAGVADTYIALVSERPHRPAMLPYKALETIIRQVRDGWFESGPVRLLLETVALYPVGSYLILSDRRLAKVVRSNGESYHQPIVRVWPSRTPPSDETGELIDLREWPDLQVLEAIPAPPL